MNRIQAKKHKIRTYETEKIKKTCDNTSSKVNGVIKDKKAHKMQKTAFNQTYLYAQKALKNKQATFSHK